MRRIRWADIASVDLEIISRYLQEHLPSCRRSTVQKLYASARSLKKYPYKGRIGRQEGTRELVVTPLPYIIAYAVDPETVHILRIMHASQDWPSIKL